MEIKILFDKAALNSDFLTGWGFPCLINDKILFDTGEDSVSLFNNMNNFGVKIEKIESVVISHNHWDHAGGLWDILKERPGLKVYACPHFSSGFKEKVKKLRGRLIENSGFQEIEKNIFVSGEILGEYAGGPMPEQALILKTQQGLTIITGCAHPGIVRMVEKIREEFPKEQLYLVMGGFHLMDKDSRLVESIIDQFRKMGIKKAAPSHCSGKEAEESFKKIYKDNFISLSSGQTIEI